jgi:hypothetical protein
MMTVSTKRSLLTELEMTGNPHGPSLYHLIEVLGKDKVIRRLGRATVHPEFSHIPLKFIMRVGILVRDTHGLPDAEYVASELKARELFRKLQHTSIEREAKPILQQDQEGAFSLLFACIDFASSHGTPISLGDISVAKIEDTEWDRDGITNVSINLFLRKAIDGMKQ